MRTVAAAQLVGTLAILAWVPTSLGKAAALLLWWAFTFGRVSRAEAALFVAACAFFTLMNALSLQQGIFAFTRPDILGMPVYEVFMWGFYLLHTRRAVGGPAPATNRAAWALAIFYTVAFGSIADPGLLLAVTGALLAGALMLFHGRYDWAYAGYMVLLGAAVEYTGVHVAGEWSYPGDPPGGVPFWFVTLWGGVGLFLRRLVLPVVARYEGEQSHD